MIATWTLLTARAMKWVEESDVFWLAVLWTTVFDGILILVILDKVK